MSFSSGNVQNDSLGIVEEGCCYSQEKFQFEVKAGATTLEENHKENTIPSSNRDENSNVEVAEKQENPGSMAMASVDDVEKEYMCGWFRFRPRCLQVFNRPGGFLLVLCIFCLAQSTTVNGLVYVVTTTLEKRFGLPSARSGSISSMYDASVMIIIIFVAYFGETANKPIWIGMGAFIFGCGSYFFTLPHFLTENYEYGTSQDESTCNPNRTIPTDDCLQNIDDGNANLSKYYWYFIAAQLIHGIGASPLYTHGQAYIHSNASVRATPIFIAVFQAISTFAPAVGYIVGALFLSIYTDVRVADEQTITSDSPLWVGNWWLGFMITGSLAILVALPLSAFPKHLPARKTKEILFDSVQKGKEFQRTGEGFKEAVKDFPKAVANIITNLPFLFLCGAQASEFFIVASIAVFGPKLLESMFALTTAEAAVIVGCMIFPASLGGVIGSGYVIRRFGLKFKGKLRFMLGLLFISWWMMLIAYFYCDNSPFAGVTVDYGNTRQLIVGESNLTSLCNFDCKCSAEYDPVCGSDDVIYYNGCFAGCKELDESSGKKEFSDCGCIPPSDEDPVRGGRALQDRCNSGGCSLQTPYVIIVTLTLLMSFAAIVPAIVSVMSVVDPSQVPTALGIHSLIYRSLGSIPGPIIFGKLVDTSCMIWEEQCGGLRTCWQYDNKDFARVTFWLVFICRIVTLTMVSLSYYFYERGGDNDRNDEANGTPTVPLKSSRSAAITSDKGVGTDD